MIASPKLSWGPVNGACSYDVQVSDSSNFPAAGGGGDPRSPTGPTPPRPRGCRPATRDHAGTWYWRVRAELCNTDTGAWSNTAAIHSQLPPQFNLNIIPTRVTYATSITVVGQLVANGSPVANPTLVLERRLYPSDTTRRSRRSMPMRRAVRVRAVDDPQRRVAAALVREPALRPGHRSFDVTVVPRVSFALNRSRVVHGRDLRRERVRLSDPSGVDPGPDRQRVEQPRARPVGTRFALNLRAKLPPGTHHLRLYVPTDTNQTMAPAGSSSRSLFVYDVIVIK